MSTYNRTKKEIVEELQLIENAKSDPDCFEDLYDKYYQDIFLFIFKRTSNQDITADIVSEVFLKAMVNLNKYVFKGVPFSAWLYRIAINEVNYYYRKTSKIRTISIESNNLSGMIEEFEEENDESRYQVIFEALKQLPEEMIQFIELRFFENRSFRDIGMIMGISENNAKVKTYRIIDRIKKIVEKNQR